jgi:hypothetical protein
MFIQPTDLRVLLAQGFKIGLCSVPPVNSPLSLTCLSNNCCVRSTFINMQVRTCGKHEKC